MAAPLKTNHTYLPPLFDRLTPDGTVLLNQEGIEESIKQEVSRLFNTRYSLQPYLQSISGQADLPIQEIPEPLSYGLEDFASGSVEDQGKLCSMLEQLVNVFEPRISEPKVTILRTSVDRQLCWVTLNGNLHLGDRITQIHFPIILQPSHP